MGIFSKKPSGAASRTSAGPTTSLVGSARVATTPTGHAYVPHSPKKPLPFSTHRNITAAAQIVDISTAEGRSAYTKRRSSAQGWQDEAWIYVNEIGEINYAFGYVANAVSRIKLYAGTVDDPTAPPKAVDVDSQVGQAANDILARLSSAYGGIPGFLRDLTLNLEISGEALLVQRPANPFASPPLPESWDIRSVDEVQMSSEGQFIITEREDGDKTSQSVLPKHAYVARIWVPSPRFSGDSTSSMRPVLSLCAELLLLNKTFRAVERSRLNSGLLYLPDGLSVAASPDADVFDDETVDSGFDQDPGSVPMPDVAFDAGEQADTDDFEEALLEAMTTPIADEESASAVVPLIVRGPAELGEKIRLIQFERTFDPTLSARAEHVLDRILQGLNVPKEVTKGLSGLKFCADTETEILTRRGWLTYDQVSTSDEVYTLNHSTGMAEWQFPTAINTFDVVDEEMMSIESSTHSSLTTLDHKWPVVRKDTNKHTTKKLVVTSADLKTSDRIIASAPLSEFPVEAKYSDDFVELVAWFFTEGWWSNPQDASKKVCKDRDVWKSFLRSRYAELGLTKTEVGKRWKPDYTRSNAGSWMSFIERQGGCSTEHRVKLSEILEVPLDVVEAHFESKANRRRGDLSQSLRANPEKVDQIRNLLVRMFGDTGWTEYPANEDDVVHFFLSEEVLAVLDQAVSGPEKQVSNDFINLLTKAQLSLFIGTAIAADGTIASNGTASFSQSVKHRAETIELAYALLGIPTSLTHIPSKVDGHKDKWTVTEKKKSLLTPVPSSTAKNQYNTRTTYTGVVWCPTTPNRTWFARRKGKTYFTSNSASEMVDVQLNANHVEPMALVIVDALTTVYLRPLLRAMGFPEDEVRKVVIWYDAFEVTRRPNRAEDADKGYSNHLISGASWRKAHQFSDDDAPTSTEGAFRMLQERGPITPELAEALLSVVAPDIMTAVRESTQSANPETAIPSEIQDILGGEAQTPDTLDSETVTEPETEPAPTQTPPTEPAPQQPQPQQVDRVIGEEELI